MGSRCISKNKDTHFEDEGEHSPKILNTKDDGLQGIQRINQTITAKNYHFKQLKESPEEGIQVQNIQTIVLMPKNAEEGAKIIRDLVQFGNQVILVSKHPIESPKTSSKSLSKKGILKNKSQVRQSTDCTTSNHFISPKHQQSKSSVHHSTDGMYSNFLSPKSQHKVDYFESKRFK